MDFLGEKEDGTTHDQTYGFIAIDGEKYPTTPMHGVVVNGLLDVIVGTSS